MKKFIISLILFLNTFIVCSQDLPKLIPYRKGMKWGFCNKNKQIIIPCKYDYVETFYGDFTVASINDRYGVINQKDSIIVPFIYEDVVIYNGLFSIEKNNKQSLINVKGETIIPFVYDYIIGIDSNFFQVSLHYKLGIFDKSGKEILPPIYDFIDKFSDGKYAVVSVGSKRGIVDKNYKFFINPIYDHISSFYNGIAVAGLDRKLVLIDTTGKATIFPKYLDSHYGFMTAEIADVYNENMEHGYINKNGQEVIGLSFHHAYPFWGDYASVEKETGWGVIDRKGNIIAPLIYDFAGHAKNNWIVVNKKNNYGIIDTTGKVIIPLKYKMIDYKGGDWIVLKLKNKCKVINMITKKSKTYKYTDVVYYGGEYAFSKSKKGKGLFYIGGKEIIPPMYQRLELDLEYGFIKVCLHNKWGVIDFKNNILIPIKYDDMFYDFEDDLNLVELNGKKGYIDINGTEYWED